MTFQCDSSCYLISGSSQVIVIILHRSPFINCVFLITPKGVETHPPNLNLIENVNGPTDNGPTEILWHAFLFPNDKMHPIESVKKIVVSNGCRLGVNICCLTLCKIKLSKVNFIQSRFISTDNISYKELLYDYRVRHSACNKRTHYIQYDTLRIYIERDIERGVPVTGHR